MPNTPDYSARQARLAAALVEQQLDAMLLNPGPSLFYLTGLNFHLMERPVTALFTPTAEPVIVLPELETAKLDGLPYALQPVTYGEDPAGWPQAFARAGQLAGLQTPLATQRGPQVAVEPTRLRYLELRYLEQALPKAAFVPGDDALSALRLCKDAAEAAAMRRAVAIAQQALLATLPVVKAGVTERQIAAELTLQLLRAGSDSEMPFAPIVSGGPNSANPHASPGDRPLQPGDLLVIDWGAASGGYVSDLTRTFGIGAVDDECRKIAEIVLAANTAGRAAGRPGVPAEAVDRAARQVIEAAGYGQYFTHRTGHGIGMEGHEPPYMRSGNTQLLKPGMAYTVEPGIYLTGRNGVRIEDDMLVTEDGVETLSDLPRELRIIEG
ncbi:MAG: M24 family metallopeptidase [Chloroflexota bacterium]